MTITFESDNSIIIYSLEEIIAFAKRNQYIFLAQSVLWISSVLGLQSDQVIYIDNLRTRSKFVSLPKDAPVTTPEQRKSDDLGQQNKILEECEEYLRDSRTL